MTMPRLQKNTLALTFKYDCDRFLRFRLSTKAEQEAAGIDAEAYKRPGIDLITACDVRVASADASPAGGAG